MLREKMVNRKENYFDYYYMCIARKKDTTYQNKYIYIRKCKACFGHTLISYCYVHSYFEHCFKISFMLKRFVKIVLNDILMCVKP